MAKRKIKIPWAKLKELAGALLAAGVDKDQIPEIIGQGLDDLIDFDELMNGPLEVVGDTLELIDGMVFTAAARLIVGIIPAPKLIAFAKDRQAARLVA